MRILVLIIALFAFTQTTSQYEHNVVINEEVIRFEHAVRIIKKYETLHQKKDYPYVGYGHLALKGERFKLPLRESEADKLLRKDLMQKVSQFRRFGKDSLILGVLSYNVGEGKLLGLGSNSKSTIITMLESGNRNIRKQYISYNRYNGKPVQSIKKRRIEEFEILYIK